jgi:hypothetical protein
VDLDGGEKYPHGLVMAIWAKIEGEEGIFAYLF